MTKPSRTAQVAADREKIRDAGTLDFLVSVMRGEPVPVRDQAGRVVDFTEAPDLGQRIDVAKHLAGKVMPNLQSQSIDLETTGDGNGLTLVFGTGLAPPASQERDVTPEPETIEHHEELDTAAEPATEPLNVDPGPDTADTPSAAPAPPEPPTRRRRRRRTST